MPSGVWSGDRATLTLTPTGGNFVEDCADATIDVPIWHGNGTHFTATGMQSDYPPGPQRADESAKTLPLVRYSGKVVGKTLELTVERADRKATTYNLRSGVFLKRIRCL